MSRNTNPTTSEQRVAMRRRASQKEVAIGGYHVLRLLDDIEERDEARPDDLRADGWTVAAHNDYRLKGESHTFWLLTRGGRCIKGEGHTDTEALNHIRAALAAKDGG